MLTKQELENKQRIEKELKFLKENPWFEQYRRVKRFHKLVITSLANTENFSSDKVDLILSFFTFCYHLGDWLINSGIDKREIRNFIKNSRELSLCRNLCLGIKHLKVVRPSIPKLANMAPGFYTPIAQIYDPSGDPGKFAVLYEDGYLEVEQLMKLCLNQWTTFLINKKLIDNSSQIRSKFKLKLKKK